MDTGKLIGLLLGTALTAATAGGVAVTKMSESGMLGALSASAGSNMVLTDELDILTRCARSWTPSASSSLETFASLESCELKLNLLGKDVFVVLKGRGGETLNMWTGKLEKVKNQ